MTRKISTDLSALVSALEEKEEIRIGEAARMLELSEHETESLAKRLAEYKILEIRYSLKGYKTLRRGPNAVKKESGSQHRKHSLSPETQKLQNALRRMAPGNGRVAFGPPKSRAQSSGEDLERQKRLREIREGLVAVRENLSKIRDTLDADLKNRQETYAAVPEPRN